MGSEDRDYLRAPREGDDVRAHDRVRPRSATPLWARIVLALLALSMIGGAVLGGF